jgi:hypothetical protein
VASSLHRFGDSSTPIHDGGIPMAEIRTTEHPRSRALFKADHPREIDRHIAFFGGEEAASPDMCGEALLDALTQRPSDDDEDEGPSCA